jgi:tartrate-resistant acid phosphatase type 5
MTPPQVRRRPPAALAILAGAALALVVPVPAGSQELRLAFLGDSGNGKPGQHRVAEQMLRAAPGAVFFLGDNIYNTGEPRDFARKFDTVYAPLVERGAALHAALGNHDVKKCRASDRAPLPPDEDAYAWREPGCHAREHLRHAPFGYVDGRRYYTVALGEGPLVEVFVLDSNTLGLTRQTRRSGVATDAGQLGWLEERLAASRARWKVVILHHPVHTPEASGYFLGIGGHGNDERLQQQLEPILASHGVDAVFAGHNHFYARLAPQRGVRYFVAGGGGRKLVGFKRAPGYLVAGGKFHHYVLVRLTPESFEYFAVDDRGRVRDAGRFGKRAAADEPLPLALPAAGDAPP